MSSFGLHVGCDGEVLVVSHLLASIPGQGAAQLLGQFAHVLTERGYYGRRVLARDFEKHHKARMALDQRRDVGVVCSGEKVSFPVAWHGAIVGLGRPLADGSRIDDLSQSALGGAAFAASASQRSAQATTGARASARRAIVARHGAPGDKALGAMPAARRADQPRWRGRRCSRRYARSLG